MLLWQGNLEAQWPEHSAVNLKIQLWSVNFKGAIPDLKIRFLGFVRPSLTPIESIRGPALSVYSKDADTIVYFSEMAASEVGILVSASAHNCSFDHLVFYAMDAEPKIYARPLILDSTPSQRHQVTQQLLDKPRSLSVGRHKPTESEQQPQQQVQPKVLQQVVLGAMRMRGFRSGDKDFDQIYRCCYKTVESILKRKCQSDLEIVREKVEAYLQLFE